jgi:hypothetical protein
LEKKPIVLSFLMTSAPGAAASGPTLVVGCDARLDLSNSLVGGLFRAHASRRKVFGGAQPCCRDVTAERYRLIRKEGGRIDHISAPPEEL